jgi:glycosyltransferase involved in cell wall biosynthesis
MSHRIQVALVITELEVGGAERCLAQVAAGLDRARFAPVVYSLAARPSESRGALVRQLDEAAVPVRFIGVRAAWQIRAAVRTLRSLLAEQRPQIVQTFLFHANVVGSLALRGSSAPRLIHGIRVADPSWWRQAVERRSTMRANKVVCVSRSVADYCAARLRVPSDKLVVIPNGIAAEAYRDLPPADLRQFGVPPGRHAIVFVGRLHPQKGLDWLFSLAPRLFEQLPDHDLLLVGDGPERGQLEANVRARGLQPRVHWAGWSPLVPQILAASELLVLPSRWEGMPNVLLEAMAAGLPIVSTRAQGVEELLGPLADEQCVDFGDTEAFLDRMRRLAENRQAAVETGRRNRERVAQYFSRAAMLQAYEGVYTSLVTP